MTLERIVGAGILSLIFIILVALFVWRGSSDDTVYSPETQQGVVLSEGITKDEIISVSLSGISPVAIEPAETFDEKKVVEIEKMAATLTVPKVVAIETPKVGWFLQIASFSQQENAKQLVKDLKQEDIEAKYDMAIGQKGQMYRVRTIPQESKEQAERTADKIKQNFNISAQLLRRKKN